MFEREYVVIVPDAATITKGSMRNNPASEVASRVPPKSYDECVSKGLIMVSSTAPDFGCSAKGPRAM